MQTWRDCSTGREWDLCRTLTFRASLPRGATLNIVCPHHPADVNVRVSNNVENGTSAARGSTHPER